jgi:DinB superfamily
MAKTSGDKSQNEVKELRTQLVALLDGGQAHATFADAVKDFPQELRGIVPDGLPYSAWQLLEHMRIAQRDILNFSAPPTGGYHGLKWPDEYWPKETVPGSADAWNRSIAAVETDLEKFKALILKPEADLARPFLWGTGQNLLREALLIADHTAYHVGELVLLRRLLGAWHK